MHAELVRIQVTCELAPSRRQSTTTTQLQPVKTSTPQPSFSGLHTSSTGCQPAYNH